MTTTELMFWEPGDTRAQVREVTDAGQVQALADELLARYRDAGDVVPGIELRRGDNGESMSVAVGPTGWALVHTDAEFTQHCTRPADVEGGSLQVRWEEPTAIPRGWFVPAESALAGVAQWLDDGTLAPQLPWSDQCF